MALSDSQKASVIFYLGWPGKTIILGAVDYNSGVNSALINLSPWVESQVLALLDRLNAVDEKLDSAACRLAAKKVDEIELNPDEIKMLKSERTRLCKLLGRLLDIKVLGAPNVNVSVCI